MVAERRNPFWGERELKRQAGSAERLAKYEAIIARTFEDEQRTRDLLMNPPAGVSADELHADLQIFEEHRALFTQDHFEEKYALHNLVSHLVADAVLEGRVEPNGDRARFLRREVAAMFLAPEVREETRQQFGGDLQGFTLQALRDRFGEWRADVPPEFLVKVVRAHQERMNARQEQAEAIFEATKAEFLSAIQREVDKGALPIDMETVHRRLGMVRVQLWDRLLEPFSSQQGAHGSDGVISFYSSALEVGQEQRLRKTIFHELTHEIAGKSIQLIPEAKGGSGGLRAFERKSGIEMAHDSRAELVKRFTWLNEAITEWYALRLSGSGRGAVASPDGPPGPEYKGSKSYVEERQELDRLFARGLPERLVLDAYFEDIRSDQPPHARGLAFAALLRNIRALENDPLAFARLEHRFALKDAASFLSKKGFRKADRFGAEEERRFPSGTLLYPVTVSIGIQESARASASFVYVARSDTSVSAEEGRVRMQEALEALQSKMGGTARCLYRVGEPRRV